MPEHQQINLGIDLTGSDSTSLSLFEPFQKGSCCFSGVNFFFFSSCPLPSSFPHIVIEKEHLVEMKDSPKSFLKKDRSSLSLGFEMINQGKLHAIYSAGNTAALVAFSRKKLGVIKKLKWPALIAQLPSKTHPVFLLDVGASPNGSATHLCHLAELGAYYWKILYSANPRVGLLNIGAESGKGPLERRQAFRMLSNQNQSDFRFVGNIESKQVFSGEIDIAVTDGFSGNIFLKTAEAAAEFILSEIPTLERLPHSSKAVEKLAILGGVKGLVFKSHGGIAPNDFYECAKIIAKKMPSFDLSSSKSREKQKV